jgi:hypothetical protein
MAEHEDEGRQDDEAEGSGDHHQRRSAGHLVNNWSSYQGSLAEKVMLAIRNRTLAHGGSRLCCGHPGQPGC